MSDLSKARGLNSIADPRKFKGSPGRGRPGGRPTPPEPVEGPQSDDRADETPPPVDRPERDDRADRSDSSDRIGRAERTGPAEHLDRVDTTDLAAGPSGADRSTEPSDREGSGRESSGRDRSEQAEVREPEPRPRATPHRAVTPGVQRQRRELSIPNSLADALEATMINPADIVMAGYRKHSDAIYAGEGGRMMAKGRTRLRLSISDTEFDQITRLGLARGWNRSETVSVILALELMPVPSASATGAGAEGTGS